MYKISSPESFRKNVKTKLNQFVSDIIICTNLEKGIYNFAIKESEKNKIIKKWENPLFVQLYRDRFYSIFVNLKNTDLAEKINSKELSAQQFAFMTHQEMDPITWKILLDKKIKKEKNRFHTRVQASTDMFTCRKCKSKNCTYYELQTRSADEPATIFITCLDCGKNWRS